MKNKLYFVLPIFFFLCVKIEIYSQGCVAIRQMNTSCGNELETNLLQKGEVQIGFNYRYFKSFRHFRGTQEEPDRVANGSEVINYSNGFELSLNYGISSRIFANISLPYVINERSSLYEHGRSKRNTTFSRGLADVRLGFGYWLFNPNDYQKGNIALGIGIKLPTGSYNSSDIFYNVGFDNSPQVRPVDQSIQPGDGGFGSYVDAQIYKIITPKFSIFATGFYLFNPRETNGIRTFRETLSPLLANESIMSVTDQFSARLGINYALNHNIGLGIGARYEGIPVRDIIGGSLGFRRPGNILSIEPSINYMKNNITINISVPIALRRERPQSVTDLETQIRTGMPRIGDSAFADYLLSFSIFYRLNNISTKTL